MKPIETITYSWCDNCEEFPIKGVKYYRCKEVSKKWSEENKSNEPCLMRDFMGCFYRDSR